MLYNKLVIGIDQSYTRTGISIAADGKLLKVTSTNFRGCTIKSAKRKHLANILHKVLSANQHKAKEVVILCERIRTFSHGGGDKDGGMFISTDYIKATGALIATIVDVAYEYGVEVYSVDTRSWKAQVVGTSKHKDKADKKMETVVHVLALGFDVSSTNTKGKVVFDDDAADSACIALYGFVPKGRQSLKKEE